MGTEYYIVKPKTKQIFYLGRRISNLEGLTSFSNTQEAKFAEWECWEDVVFDLQENSRYFLEGGDLTIGQIWDFCLAIYDFCDSEVYMDNDCSDNHAVWGDWEEIDLFSDILTTEERWEELVISNVPTEYWVSRGSVLLAFQTLENYFRVLRQKEGENKHD